MNFLELSSLLSSLYSIYLPCLNILPRHKRTFEPSFNYQLIKLFKLNLLFVNQNNCLQYLYKLLQGDFRCLPQMFPQHEEAFLREVIKDSLDLQEAIDAVLNSGNEIG